MKEPKVESQTAAYHAALESVLLQAGSPDDIASITLTGDKMNRRVRARARVTRYVFETIAYGPESEPNMPVEKWNTEPTLAYDKRK